MNKTNIFLTTLILIMFSALSQAEGTKLKDLGMDGEARMYDVICSSGKGTTLFQLVGPALANDIEPLEEDAEIVDLASIEGDDGIDFTPASKPTVCTATGGGDLDCAEYEDLDTAAEAVCKQLG